MDNNVDQQTQPTPEATPVQPQVAPIQSNVVIQSQMPAQPVQEVVQPVEEVPAEAPKKSNKGFIIALIIVLLAIIGVIVGVVIYKNNDSGSNKNKEKPAEVDRDDNEGDDDEVEGDLLDLAAAAEYYKKEHKASCRDISGSFVCDIGDVSVDLWAKDNRLESVKVESIPAKDAKKYFDYFIVTKEQKAKADVFFEVADEYIVLQYSTADLYIRSDSSNTFGGTSINFTSTDYVDGNYITLLDKDSIELEVVGVRGYNPKYQFDVVQGDKEGKTKEELRILSSSSYSDVTYDYQNDIKEIEVEYSSGYFAGKDYKESNKSSQYVKEIEVVKKETIDINGTKVYFEGDKSTESKYDGDKPVNRFVLELPLDQKDYGTTDCDVTFEVVIRVIYDTKEERDKNYQSDYEYAMKVFSTVKAVK